MLANDVGAILLASIDGQRKQERKHRCALQA